MREQLSARVSLIFECLLRQDLSANPRLNTRAYRGHRLTESSEHRKSTFRTAVSMALAINAPRSRQRANGIWAPSLWGPAEHWFFCRAAPARPSDRIVKIHDVRVRTDHLLRRARALCPEICQNHASITPGKRRRYSVGEERSFDTQVVKTRGDYSNPGINIRHYCEIEPRVSTRRAQMLAARCLTRTALRHGSNFRWAERRKSGHGSQRQVGAPLLIRRRIRAFFAL